jgi:hypothetical protein
MRCFKVLAAALVLAGLCGGSVRAAGWPPPAPAVAQDPAEFLGSEDYFEAHGGTARDYVIALYADVLGRAPSEAEIRRWSDRFMSCGNGVTLAREFLIYAHSELATRPPVGIVVPPPFPVPDRPHWRHHHRR